MIYKERLYDFLVDLGVDPNDWKRYPRPGYLKRRYKYLHIDEPFCSACIEDFLEEKGLLPDLITCYYTENYNVSVEDLFCAECGVKLFTTPPGSGIAEDLLDEVRCSIQNRIEVPESLWIDLWAGIHRLDAKDPLWDLIGDIPDAYRDKLS